MGLTMVAPCRRCGGEVVQKSRARLFGVGVLMLAGTGVGLLGWAFRAPATLLGLTGAYLVAWAAAGGRWCRGHKGFDGV